MSLKQCCATGSLHTGIPTGRIDNIQGRDCYIADAPNGSPKGIVVIIPDALGWDFPNNRILADCYAKEGNFQVYLPDFMTSGRIPEDALVSLKAMSATGFWNQLAKFGHLLYLIRYMVPFLYYNRTGVAGSRVYSWVKALKENEAKNLPVGTAGFCWGGHFVTHLCADDIDNRTSSGERATDCGFVAHPSMLTFPKDIENINLPWSCAAAEHDGQMSPDNAKRTEEIVKTKTAKTKSQGVEHEFVMYDKVHHGFAVRADEDDHVEAEAGQKAEKQAVDWFSRWFANPPP